MFIGKGVVAQCEGQGNELRADSAEYYPDQQLLFLIGSVRYREPRATVNSDRMTYFQAENRLHAEGNVVAVLSNGSTMRGPVADYFRAVPPRTSPRLVATGRPNLRLLQRDTAGTSQVPTVINATQIVTEGDSLVFASGQVDITRPGLDAKADSAFVDSEAEFARLMRSPQVRSTRDRPFTLTAGVIDLFSRKRQLQRVLATPDGHLLSQDLELVADSIDMRVTDNQLDQLYAWGPKRAHALSPDREIRADSIHAIMDGRTIKEMRALRKAYMNSLPDTSRVVSSERDWMQGDTIVARFSRASADSSARSVPREVIATGDARSYYQMPGESRTKGPPTINYVRGRVITAAFTEGRLNIVTVTEKAGGVVLEPTRVIKK
jgi:lipopolysaccharide export system protein LptA